MDIVFAKQDSIVSHPTTGATVPVVHGTHWPADDPVVLAYRDFFTDDPRYGLSSSRPLGEDGYPVGVTPTNERPARGAVETTDAAPGAKRTRGASK